jgi:hypothetical protein
MKKKVAGLLELAMHRVQKFILKHTSKIEVTDFPFNSAFMSGALQEPGARVFCLKAQTESCHSSVMAQK